MGINALETAKSTALNDTNVHLILHLLITVPVVFTFFFGKKFKNKKLEAGTICIIVLYVAIQIVCFSYFAVIYYDIAAENYVTVEDCACTYSGHSITVKITHEGKTFKVYTAERADIGFVPTGTHKANLIYLKNCKRLVYIELIE